MPRGRKSTLNNPVRINFKLEKVEKEAADATRFPYSAIFRLGLKQCHLTRAEIWEKLAMAEDQKADKLDNEAAMHRHRAEEYREKVVQRKVVEP